MALSGTHEKRRFEALGFFALSAVLVFSTACDPKVKKELCQRVYSERYDIRACMVGIEHGQVVDKAGHSYDALAERLTGEARECFDRQLEGLPAELTGENLVGVLCACQYKDLYPIDPSAVDALKEDENRTAMEAACNRGGVHYLIEVERRRIQEAELAERRRRLNRANRQHMKLCQQAGGAGRCY